MSHPLSETDHPFRGFDAESLEPQEAYRLILHCVSPRPIAFTSTLSAEGLPNLAPFSYFMVGGANPPSVVISPLTPRTGPPKDTLRNIEETGEYAISVVTYAMREPMNLTSADYPHGVNEWEVSGFTAAPSVKVRPPRVAQSPLAMECRLHQVVRHGDGPLSANYIIGEVVYFHVAESLLDENGLIDARRIDAVARMGGSWYSHAHESAMFELPRPPRIDR